MFIRYLILICSIQTCMAADSFKKRIITGGTGLIESIAEHSYNAFSWVKSNKIATILIIGGACYYIHEFYNKPTPPQQVRLSDNAWVDKKAGTITVMEPSPAKGLYGYLKGR